MAGTHQIVLPNPVLVRPDGTPFTNTRSLVLGGVNEYASGGDILKLSYFVPTTFFSWVKYTGTGFKVIASKGDGSSVPGYRFFVEGGSPQLLLGDGSSFDWTRTSINPVINDGSWHLIIMGWDGNGGVTSHRFWVDGQPLAVTSRNSGNPSDFSHSTEPFEVGRLTSSGLDIQYMVGTIGDFGIFNGVLLSDSEAAALYNSGVESDVREHSQESSLYSYWTFDHPNDDATGGTGQINDFSGNGNTLTPQNTEAEDIVEDAP